MYIYAYIYVYVCYIRMCIYIYVTTTYVDIYICRYTYCVYIYTCICLYAIDIPFTQKVNLHIAYAEKEKTPDVSLTDWVEVVYERFEVFFPDLEYACAVLGQVVEDTADKNPRNNLHDEVDEASSTLRLKPCTLYFSYCPHPPTVE